MPSSSDRAIVDCQATLRPDGRFDVSLRAQRGTVREYGERIMTRAELESLGWRFTEEPTVGITVQLLEPTTP